MTSEIKINRIFCSHETTDYSVFKKMDGNRFVDPRRVDAIVTSIKENGFYESHIKVNESLEIIDGQHRFEACKALGLPIFYDVHVGIGLADCVALNTGMSNWKMYDFINSYASQENPDYVFLRDLLVEFSDIPMSIVTAVCRGTYQSGTPAKELKRGLFKVKNSSDQIHDALNYLKGWVQMFKDRREMLSKTMLATILCAYDCKEIDKNRLFEQAAKMPMPLYNDAQSCRKALEYIYNLRSRKPKVYFDGLLCRMSDAKNEIRKEKVIAGLSKQYEVARINSLFANGEQK